MLDGLQATVFNTLQRNIPSLSLIQRLGGDSQEGLWATFSVGCCDTSPVDVWTPGHCHSGWLP